MQGIGAVFLILFGLTIAPVLFQPSIVKAEQPTTEIGFPLLHDLTSDNENYSAQLETSEGHMISILTLFANHLDKEVHYTVIAEVRDEDGVTTFLQWQSALAPAAGDLNAPRPRITFTWQPAEAGIYEVRNFAISNFTQPEVLTLVKTGRAEVT